MQKPTLLEITQTVLNDISGDEVDSILDTVESEQVASIVKSTYEDMISGRNWPHTRKLSQPMSDATSSNPTHLRMSDSLKELVSVHYDCSNTSSNVDMDKISYLFPDDFLRHINSRGTSNSNIDSVTDPSGVVLSIINNAQPTYFTSFDDVTLVLDSYNKDVEPFLSKSKFQIYAYFIPDWTHDDTFVPDLPVDAFSLLISEATSRAALKLRQQSDPKAERQSQKQERFMARKSWRAHTGFSTPDYGRQSRKYGYCREPTFRQDN